jgi:hypothetical protein
MSRLDRKNAILVAVISAIAVVAAALINSAVKKQPINTQPAASFEQSKTENTAKTTGPQSPAVAGAKDVNISYGQTPAKEKPEKSK